VVARATRDAVSGIRAAAKVPRSVSGSEPASNGSRESPFERQGTDAGDGGQRHPIEPVGERLTQAATTCPLNDSSRRNLADEILTDVANWGRPSDSVSGFYRASWSG
jgi:hypothetical protein